MAGRTAGGPSRRSQAARATLGGEHAVHVYGERATHTYKTERHETPLERLDRNLSELTAELRIVVTGVQVLFAFLLIVPFNSGFAKIDTFERVVYFVTLLLAALAAICTIAPAAQHRILFRNDDKAHLVTIANRFMLAGLAVLALAMCGCLLLVARKLFGDLTALLTLAVAAPAFMVP